MKAVSASEPLACGTGRCRAHDSRRRSVVKSITYRITNFVVSLVLYKAAVILAATWHWPVRPPNLGLKSLSVILLVDFAWRLTLYFIHDRVWDQIPFGRTIDSSPDEQDRSPVLRSPANSAAL